MNYTTHKLLIVTDAWAPQTNGVVTTLSAVTSHLPQFGIEATVLHPGLFKTWPLPSYPEIRIARNPSRVSRMIAELNPQAIHIATEGPLGLAARRYCRKHKIAFTTSLHTKFPEYINVRLGLPLAVGYRFLRWFHGGAATTLVTTASHRDELSVWGLDNLYVWGRGVDTEKFQPRKDAAGNHIKPRLTYVGRVAVEKNIEAFLALDVDAEKVVVGDGPARAQLQAKYPEASWLGYRHGQALVEEYAKADVFVFPSKTDTFGLVMLEAMACGTPVAAYPVVGPKDVVVNGVNGCTHNNLHNAVAGALRVSRASCRDYALAHNWQSIAGKLASQLVAGTGQPLCDQRDHSPLAESFAA